MSQIQTVAFTGIETRPIDVQTQISAGLPAFSVVGLPDKAVAESRDRIRAALHAIGLALPAKRITINLAPADLQKEGSHFDLPIAMGILSAMGLLPGTDMLSYLVMGELALDGRITHVPGILVAAMSASDSGHTLICPADCGPEAMLAPDVDIIAPQNLIDLLAHLKGDITLPLPTLHPPSHHQDTKDFQDIRGQESLKRAIEVSAAGGHNLLMCGPPGTGKSLISARIPSILPQLSIRDALEVSMIRSVCGTLRQDHPLSLTPAFRDPHHSASLPALIGGGRKASPGEVSLAHRGILFLDELPEFSRPTLEALRQPLETGTVSIARANHHVTYPARFQLIAAMNPCRCGYLTDPAQACRQAPGCADQYQAKISGPLLDRFDMRIEVSPVSAFDMMQPPPKEKSADIRTRIQHAYEIQQHRLKHLPHLRKNADLGSQELEKFAWPDADGQKMLRQATQQLNLSARGFHRVLRVARTIADLAQSEKIGLSHLAEALSYRGFKY